MVNQTIGTLVQQWTHELNASNQHWYFEEKRSTRSDAPMDESIYSIRSVHTGQYIDVKGISTADGT